MAIKLEASDKLDEESSTESGRTSGVTEVQAWLLVVAGTGNVKVAPLDAVIDELLEEGSGCGRATSTTVAHRLDVALCALQLLGVLLSHGQTPNALIHITVEADNKQQL